MHQSHAAPQPMLQCLHLATRKLKATAWHLTARRCTPLCWQALKERGVEFVVAPYEADAQLAYLARSGAVHAVLTEDSDMLPYGCPRVSTAWVKLQSCVATSMIRSMHVSHRPYIYSTIQFVWYKAPVGAHPGPASMAALTPLAAASPTTCKPVILKYMYVLAKLLSTFYWGWQSTNASNPLNWPSQLHHHIAVGDNYTAADP